MGTPLIEFTKLKKRTRIVLNIIIIGLALCYTAVLLLSAYFTGLKKGQYSGIFGISLNEEALIEFLWMVFLLLSFYLTNLLIWYSYSYTLIKRFMRTLESAGTNINNDALCYSCGIKNIPGVFKTESKEFIKPIKFFNIRGNFCSKCFQRYSQISIITSILIPATYVIILFFTLFLLMILRLSYIPESFWYLFSMILPVLAFSFIAIILYSIILKRRILKIYGRDNLKL